MKNAKGQFLRLRPASLGTSTRPPPARGPSVRLRTRAPALSLRPAESVSLSEPVLAAAGAKGLRRAPRPIIFFPRPLSRPTSLFTPLSPLRSHGGPVGGHSVPVRLLDVLRGRALRARRGREPGSLPRPGDEELRLLLCG